MCETCKDFLQCKKATVLCSILSRMAPQNDSQRTFIKLLVNWSIRVDPSLFTMLVVAIDKPTEELAKEDCAPVSKNGTILL